MTDQLKREGDPPAGQLASPKPQMKDVDTNDWEEVKGKNGATFQIAVDEDGNPIANSNGVLIRSNDVAQETTLTDIKNDIDTMKDDIATLKDAIAEE